MSYCPKNVSKGRARVGRITMYLPVWQRAMHCGSLLLHVGGQALPQVEKTLFPEHERTVGVGGGVFVGVADVVVGKVGGKE